MRAARMGLAVLLVIRSFDEDEMKAGMGGMVSQNTNVVALARRVGRCLGSG
jgi:hypothetical protein